MVTETLQNNQNRPKVLDVSMISDSAEQERFPQGLLCFSRSYLPWLGQRRTPAEPRLRESRRSLHPKSVSSPIQRYASVTK